MSKINMFEMDAWTFWSGLEFLRLLLLPKCIRNHHTEFEFERIILTNHYGHTDFLVMIRELLCFRKGTLGLKE